MSDSFARRALARVARRFGYVPERDLPADPEPTSLALGSVEDLFAADPLGFAEIMVRNREVVRGVPRWLDEEVWQRSYWRYGVKRGPASLEGVEPRVTYTDVLVFLARHLRKGVRYLEIGVSAGKNFLPMCHQLEKSTLVGLDIEEINPVLEAYLSGKEVLSRWDEEFTDRGGERRTKTSSLTRYAGPAGNSVLYLSGDKFKPATWEALRGHRFNLILSDAYHRPESIESEWRFLRDYELIDPEEFVFLWDDLGGPMIETFERISREVCRAYGLSDDAVRTWALHGTYGKREAHPVGCVCKLASGFPGV